MADDLFAALAEPRRRAILNLLKGPEMAAGEVAARFEVTRPAISQHLRVLRDSGLISERREGTRRLYRARPEGLAELRSYLDEFWETGLERLRQSAEAEQLERTRRRGRRGAA
jgi:DNA-binding transcriptional ArsR family regulator